MSSGEDDFFADLAPVRKAPPPPPPREPTPPPPEEPKEVSPPPGPPMRKPAPPPAVPLPLPSGDDGVAAEVAASLRRFEAGLTTVLRGMNR